jgi:hypothetical protein
MSEVKPGSGVDLVKRMQPDEDLEIAWMMFDHVKRVRQWTTMACHVYDSTYCRVMTIASCGMQSEDCDAHIVFEKNLNFVMERNGVVDTNFKGFYGRQRPGQLECSSGHIWQREEGGPHG